jgi:hypothetical protein
MTIDGDPPVTRQEVEALLEARRELGPTYDAELVDSFAERVERAVAERVDATLAERNRDRRQENDHEGHRFALAIVSLGTGIPITAVAGTFAELPGVVAAWVGIVGVNVSYALRNRRGR